MILSSLTSTVADSFGGFCSILAFLPSAFGAASFTFSVTSSAAELADKAYSTAASLAAKSAYLAASASSADFLLFSALDFSAYYFF